MSFKWIIALYLVFTGCSLDPRSSGTALIDVTIRSTINPEIFNSNGPILMGSPNSVSDFHCFMINVLGPGIPPADDFQHQNNAPLDAILNGNHCAYPGIVSGVKSASNSTSLNVEAPVGSDRLLQVLGLRIEGSCESVGDPLTTSVHFYSINELGRTKFNLFNDVSLSMTSSYSPQNKKDLQRCGELEPNNIADLRLWVRADDFVHAGYVDGANLVGELWTNASAVGPTNLTGVGTGGSLSLVHNGPGGHAYVQYNGSGNFHNSAANLSTGSTGHTLFMVAKNTGTTGSLFRAEEVGVLDYIHLNVTSTTLVFTLNNNAPTVNVVATNPNYYTSPDFKIFNTSWSQNAYPIATFEDIPASAVSLMNQTLTLDGYTYVGGGSSNITGGIAEVLYYDRKLSDNEQSSVLKYLKDKYEI